jgi:ketosteroid isomerase-like protein
MPNDSAQFASSQVPTGEWNEKTNHALCIRERYGALLRLGARYYPKTCFRRGGGDSSGDEIKQLEQERNQALLRGDAAALARMTSDDYTFINQRGELRTKAEIVSGFKSGTYKYEARQISDLKVRVYGNTAIVTGRATQKGVENIKDYSGENRFTRVYVKQEGCWVSVALQVTSVAKP